jgi:hypothetical protein
VVIETMEALKDKVRLKIETWPKQVREQQTPEELKETLAMNFLFVGDTGYRIPDLFALLEQADLEFISMVNWRQWDLTDLFQQPDDLPLFWQMGLATADTQDRLQLFELLHPHNRLMDFWCGHPGPAGLPVDDWDDTDWQTALVHLHPQLRTEAAKSELIHCIQTAQVFDIGQFADIVILAPVFLEANVAACLLPLWDGPQPIQVLAERYLKSRPLNFATLEPLSENQAFAAVRNLLNRLDAFLYVLLERG